MSFINPAPGVSDWFGISLAPVGADKILIGASHDNSGATDSGSAWLFHTNGSLLTTFTNPTPSSPEYFGHAVAALGADRVIIGSYGEDSPAGDVGVAYLYRSDGAMLTMFPNPSPAINDWFGYAVSAVGTDKVLVGARLDDVGDVFAGAAYLFDTNGTLLTVFTNPTPQYGEVFGSSLTAIGADQILIGASQDNTGAPSAGAAYLFNAQGALLTTFTNPVAGAGDYFGFSLAALSSDRLLIGAPEDSGGAADSAAVYLFRTDGVLLTAITNPIPRAIGAAGDRFGAAIAAVGTNKVLVGASGRDVAYLYTLKSSERGPLTIADAAAPEGELAVFTLTLASNYPEALHVAFATEDGSARAGADYAPTNGTLVFAPGQTTASLSVQLFGDVLDESNEFFFVNLTATAHPELNATYAVGRVSDQQIHTPLSITQQPTNQTVGIGSNVTFSVTASGTPPLTYQWRSNGANLAGAMSSDFTISNVQSHHEADYAVVVRDPSGSMTSQVARLTVVQEITIIEPPRPLTVVPGETAAFSVLIDGYPPPFTFEWRAPTGIVQSVVLNQRQHVFTLPNVQPAMAGNYRVVVRGSPSLPGATHVFALSIAPDHDSDGVSDLWEAAFGMDTNSLADAELDPDADGRTNLEEYLSGTDPIDPASVFKIDRVIPGNPNTLEFIARSNRTYSAQFNDSLAPGNWTRFAEIIARPTNRLELLTDPAASPTRFYRVVTPIQP
jgi:hypothetical protein